MVLAALGTIINNSQFGLFAQESTSIEPLTGIVDIYTDEFHRQTVTKTKYPVETGASLTDNAVIDPKVLTLKGYVSDLNPLLGGLITIPGPGRGREAWSRIVALKDAREPVTVVTLLEVYENMLITSIDAPKSAATGQGLEFTITLEEILFAETQITVLPSAQLGADIETKGSVVEEGQKQSIDSEESVLKALSDGLKEKATELISFIKGNV